MIKKQENIWRSRFLLRNLRCVKSAMNVCIMNDNKIWQDWTILFWAIAREHLVSSPLSQQFVSTHHLPATSSVKTALKALVDKQLVSKTPTSYLVSDRFFAKWLVRGGIIANWGNENYVPMLGYGEMDDNNAATYTMQGINYNDARKPFLRLRDICHAFIRHLSYDRMTNVV